MAGCDLTLASCQPVLAASVYQDTDTPEGRAAWNADPAIDTSGQGQPPPLPQNHDRPIVGMPHEPPHEPPSGNTLSKLNHTLAPYLGGGIGLGAMAMAGLCGTNLPGVVICGGASVVGGLGGLAAAQKADGRPLSELTMAQWNNAAFAGFFGAAQGAAAVWAAVFESKVAQGVSAVTVSTLAGRGMAVGTEMSEKNVDFHTALRHTAKDLPGLGFDILGGGASYLGAVANNTRILREALTPKMGMLAEHQGKDVAHALWRSGELKEVFPEGFEIFKNVLSDFMSAVFDQGRVAAELLQSRFAPHLKSPAFADAVVEWAGKAAARLAEAEPLWDKAATAVVKQIAVGCRRLQTEARVALMAEADSVAGMSYLGISKKRSIQEMAGGVAKLDAELANGVGKGPHWTHALEQHRSLIAKVVEDTVDTALMAARAIIERSPDISKEKALSYVAHAEDLLTDEVLKALPKAFADFCSTRVGRLKDLVEKRFL